MVVRLATLADVPDLVRMGRAFRAQSSPSYAAIIGDNDAQLAHTASWLIEAAADRALVVVAEGRDGALVAMLGLMAVTHLMSGALTVGEVFWWSEVPAVGMLLFRRGRQWAQDVGATAIQMIQPVSEERLATVYERMGFQRVEVAWQLDLTAREAVA